MMEQFDTLPQHYRHFVFWHHCFYWPLPCGGYQISIAYCLFFICSNDDRRLTLTYFYGKVKFGNIGLSIGTSENLIFQNFCSLWPENNWDNEDMWVLKVKVISWPWPKVIYIWRLKLAFLRNDWAVLNQILFCAWPKYQVSVSQDHWSSG